MVAKHILIVGGGIGGLTLANFLSHHGFEWQLIEKTSAWKPIGAGLTLTPNALRVFDEIGLVQDLMQTGNELKSGSMLDEQGKLLNHLDYSHLRKKYGFATLGIHRAELHKVLLKRLDAGRIRTGVQVAEITNTREQAIVRFSDGTSGDYDLVVGADGIHSQMRTYCAKNAEKRYSGYTGWSFTVSNQVDFPGHHVINQLGAGKRFGVIPIGSKELYCWASVNVPQHSPWLEKTDTAGFCKLMSGFGGHIPGILASISPDTNLYLTEASDIQIKNWHHNKIVLLGDSAHAITPNLGMGASMAIEDASVLTRCLCRFGDLPHVLNTYQSSRKSRVKQVAELSYWAGAIGQWQSPLARVLRDSVIGLMPSTFSVKNLERIMMREI